MLYNVSREISSLVFLYKKFAQYNLKNNHSESNVFISVSHVLKIAIKMCNCQKCANLLHCICNKEIEEKQKKK